MLYICCNTFVKLIAVMYTYYTHVIIHSVNKDVTNVTDYDIYLKKNITNNKTNNRYTKIYI